MKRIKFIRLLIAVVISFGLLFSINSTVLASVNSNEIPYTSYTYWEDLGDKDKQAVYSKPMYEIKTVIDSRKIPENFGSITQQSLDNCKKHNLLREKLIL